jgi:hypothetical protein
MGWEWADGSRDECRCRRPSQLPTPYDQHDLPKSYSPRRATARSRCHLPSQLPTANCQLPNSLAVGKRQSGRRIAAVGSRQLAVGTAVGIRQSYRSSRLPSADSRPECRLPSAICRSPPRLALAPGTRNPVPGTLHPAPDFNNARRIGYINLLLRTARRDPTVNAYYNTR